MAVKPIALSFKNNKEDMELYEWIASHSNMSGFIKDALRAVKYNEAHTKSLKISTDSIETGLIDMNF
jgi:hypothetical protein